MVEEVINSKPKPTIYKRTEQSLTTIANYILWGLLWENTEKRMFIFIFTIKEFLE